MNTNKLKTFSKNARLILLKGVRQRLSYWGFDEKGNVVEEVTPIEGGYMFREEAYNDPTVYKKWTNLKAAIKRHTFEDIVEEAAYTWFNRLIAIKILEKNGYIDPVYEYVSDELQDPVILQRARRGETVELRDDEKKLLNQYIVESKDEEAFGLLITAYCRNQKLLNRIFGRIDDYTELLLPNDLLSGGGIVEHINTTEAITDEDYKQVELIGWLYQFYISDRKNEVFAGFKKKKKARPEDIPAATQIFTPKWIVKYMVENTVGRIWLDLHPDSSIRNEMKYLVEPADKENYKPEPIIKSVTELTLMDPASGSGHILVEGFDLLMKMYLEEGYTTKNAVESIIRNNLYGLEIDDRAAQLANFAVLLKAAMYHRVILKSDFNPNIYSFPEAQEISQSEISLFLDKSGIIYKDRLKEIFGLLQQGIIFGSTINIELPREMREYVYNQYKYYETQFINDLLEIVELAFWLKLRQFIHVIILLTDKYTSVVSNPPYMSNKNMNNRLKNFINNYYPFSKSDLYSVFIEKSLNITRNNGYIGMITQHSWMFLSSYEVLRGKILNEYFIESMIHLGSRAFEEVSGEVVQSTSFALSKNKKNNLSVFKRLISKQNKEESFFDSSYTYKIKSNYFLKIPGTPIAYWITDKIVEIFISFKKLSDYHNVKKGIDTGENKRFLRYWPEIDIKKFSKTNHKLKWFSYIKGGAFVKWYGNLELVVNWENEGADIKNYPGSTIRNIGFMKRKAITWSLTSSNRFGARLVPTNCIFDNNGSSVFPQNEEYHIIGYMNSIVALKILEILNPTMAFQVGDISRLPYIKPPDKIAEISKICVDIAKLYWDSKEMSWEFKRNELLLIKESPTLQMSYENYHKIWYDRLLRLKSSEEEINSILIDIYELNEELKSEVMLKDVTILQEETYINENNELIFKKDEVIKQFISYSVGCMFGRYSIDKDGLILANQGDTFEEYRNQIPSPTFKPDENGILPLMGNESNFSDDLVIRFKQFLEITFSTKTLTENINFIQECLDMDLEKFLTEKFWHYHCKMYKKKPIYWLFSSPKGAFKVLVYMHRMNKFTVQKIRNNYLLKHLAYLRSEIAKLEENASNLSKTEVKRLDQLRSDEIECREYDKLVKDYADKQIEFDLDDGVSVNYKKFKDIVAPIK